MATQQANFVFDVNARIDARIDDHMASLKAEMTAMKGSMVAEVSASTQSALTALTVQMTHSMSVAVQAEVSGLEKKFAGMLDNSSSIHSGSQQTAASALSIVSQHSANSHERGGGAARAVVPDHDGCSQQWICPICLFPLKHEKSFYDHFSLLQSRVHQLPGVVAGKRRQKKVKKCLWDIDNPDHNALLIPWDRPNLNFWNKAHLFGTALLKLLKPGTPDATHDDNPRHAVVFSWLEECRNGVFVPRLGSV